MKKMSAFISLLLLLSCLTLPGMAQAAGQTLMLATTTSTDNTGLLDELAPLFKADTGIELRWTAVGTGKALKMGENCDVDVLLVHDTFRAGYSKGVTTAEMSWILETNSVMNNILINLNATRYKTYRLFDYKIK